MRTWIMLILSVMLGACTTTVNLGPAYHPIPDIREDVRKEHGNLKGFALRARGMSGEQLVAVEKRATALKTQCHLGVEDERREISSRPNPHVSKTERSLTAVGMGVPEQLVLFDATFRIDCKQPELPKQQRRKW